MARYWALLAIALALPAVSIGAAVQDSASKESAPTTPSAPATGADIPREYRPPTGFGAYKWNEPLADFRRLVPDPVYVHVTHSDGHVDKLDLDCIGNGSPLNVCSEFTGEGFYALAEYYVDSQGFRLSDARQVKTTMFPVTYQFCATWNGITGNMQGDVLQNMKLCGARLFFRSETAKQEQEIRDPNYLTPAERVLDWLIENYGEPEKFEKRARVIVGIQDQQPESRSRKSRNDTWYWCSTRVDEMVPKCPASIVFTFDSETGWGQVLFTTPTVWAFAYARRHGGSEDDSLYRILHGNIGQGPAPHSCTGTYICKPSAPGNMPDKMLARFRLPTEPKQQNP